MDPLALGLVLAAAGLHATWNVLLKTSGDPLRTSLVGVAGVAVVLAPAALAAWVAAGRPPVPPAAVALGVVSGLVEVAYYAFLAAAYRRGDLSLVYPLARGTAPLIAIAVGLGLLGERLPPLGVAGVALLVAGLAAVLRPWRLLRRVAADRAAAGFALLTGAAIATYTSLDRVGVRLLDPWLYSAILWPTCAAGLAVLVALRDRRAGRAGPGTGLAAGVAIRPALAAGGLMFLAYGLVLVALSRAPLAVVAPLRESAVLLASAWAVVRLREASSRADAAGRLAGSALVLAGAVALAVAR